MTNSVERIYNEITKKDFVPKDIILIEHYEPSSICALHELDIVTINSEGRPKWTKIDEAHVREITNCEADELNKLTLEDERLNNEIEQMRTLIDPHINKSNWPTTDVMLRKMEIKENMISKASIQSLIESGVNETKLGALLKSDLSIFAELYAKP